MVQTTCPLAHKQDEHEHSKVSNTTQLVHFIRRMFDNFYSFVCNNLISSVQSCPELILYSQYNGVATSSVGE